MGAVTPGIHLRWLPGARVEFPYRERTMGVEFAIGDGNGVGTLFAVVPEVAGLTGG
jgi:hypothetical protein